ncbi:hypothetical protein HMPREF1869_00444 [Bacteroidales bacterium KA00251]|nr:hypothetical protein HMPREF1869_00444 [Bacteroidales bacterium KA00251]
MDDCKKSFVSHLVHRGVLAYILLSLIMSCSKAPQASKEIIIRLPALGSMRALGTSYGKGDFMSDPYQIGQPIEISSVEIHFWDISKRVEVQQAITFRANSPEIAQLKAPSGYKLTVPSRCEAISVVCNPERLSNNILDYQGRTIAEMPLLSDKVSIQKRPNGLAVELYPKPPVARLEIVSGVSAGSYAAAGGVIKNIRITGLYINNYIKNRSTGERSYLSHTDYFPSNGGFWFGHEQKMHNLESTLHNQLLQYDRQTGRNSYADFYYVFPRTEESPSSIDHLIIRLDYDKNGQRYTNRFITIQSYLVKGASGSERLARFEAGHNYNIKLSDIFSQFTTDNDPTSDKPEVPFINVVGLVETPGENPPIIDDSTIWD